MLRARLARAAAAAMLLALLAMPAVLAMPGAAGWRVAAHAQLVASSPGAGTIIPDAPVELILVFSEPLEGSFSTVDLTDADGRTILARSGTVDASDRHQLVVRLPPLDDGVYSVSWRSLSAADGHTAAGSFSFGVGEPHAQIPAGGLTHSSADEAGVATAVGRWLGYLGPLAGFGVPVIAAGVLRRPPRVAVVRLVGGLLILSAGATAALALRAALDVAGGDVAGYLLGSRNGPLQLARALVLGLGGASVVVLAKANPRAALGVAWGAALIGIGLLVVAGHAAASPGIGQIAAQAVHVAAVGTWLSGIVMLLALMVLPGAIADEAPEMPRLVPRFSALALASIGLVASTGAFASWIQTGTLPDTSSTYWRVLLVKLGLAFAALAVGGLNYLDGGRGRGWLGGLRWRLSAEVSLAGAVLVVTGLLATTPPVATALGIGIRPVPDAFGSVVPGMSLELAPGRPGVNHVAVTVEGALADASLELVLDRLDGSGGQSRVHLRPMSEGHEMGTMQGSQHGAGGAAEGADQFVADAVVLPPASSWDASVRVLAEADGRELSRQRFAFAMGDEGLAAGRAAGPVDPGLVIAALVAVVGAMSIGLGLGGWRLPRCEAAASRMALVWGGGVGVALGILIGIGRIGLTA